MLFGRRWRAPAPCSCCCAPISTRHFDGTPQLPQIGSDQSDDHYSNANDASDEEDPTEDDQTEVAARHEV
jgi:hypothetical protein